MSSIFTIKMNYQRSIRPAEQLDRLAEQIRRVGSSKIKQAREAEARGWKGDNEKLMRTKHEVLQDKVNTTANSLRNIANAIRTIAKNTYDAEMRAWEIAHRRTYNG